MNHTPFFPLEHRIEILAGLLALSQRGFIGPVFCECDCLRLELGHWPDGVSHILPPNRYGISWNQAADIVARGACDLKGKQYELGIHARQMRDQTSKKPTKAELRRAQYLAESGKLA